MQTLTQMLQKCGSVGRRWAFVGLGVEGLDFGVVPVVGRECGIDGMGQIDHRRGDLGRLDHRQFHEVEIATSLLYGYLTASCFFMSQPKSWHTESRRVWASS